MNMDELERETIRLSRSLDEALTFLKDAAVDYAHKDDAYRVAKATAYLTAEGTVGDRTATADLATSKQRVEASIADGMKQAGLEAVRSRRQQLSALQSLMSAHRAEAEFARTAL